MLDLKILMLHCLPKILSANLNLLILNRSLKVGNAILGHVTGVDLKPLPSGLKIGVWGLLGNGVQ